MLYVCLINAFGMPLHGRYYLKGMVETLLVSGFRL